MRSATMLAGGTDTIVALATAEGRGALAVVRVSGPGARALGQAMGTPDMAPRVATRVALRHPVEGVALDDALATWFPGPRSYTGEDVLELSTHGGRVVPAAVVAACVAAGARLAYPGEFTRRAVLNGRMDLLQAEAVADLIDARTTAMQRQALAQLDGGLSRRCAALRDEVIHLEALLAYDIDFPGEDDGPIDASRITAAAVVLRDALDALLATAPRAALLRDGALVVIAGPPNAGKSSLFNALLGESRALVTPIAGTTRDAIEAVLDRGTMPLRLVDTAGLRESDDVIERLGIEVSTRYVGQARVVLACGEDAADVRQTIDAVRTLTDAPIVAVRTKSDLASGTEPGSAIVRAPDDTMSNHDALHVSAESGAGLAQLLLRIDAALRERDGSASGGASDETATVMVTRERHRAGVAAAREEITQFLDVWVSGDVPPTVAAVHLQAARDALSDVTGAIGTEDILDRVFRDFCIGK